MMTPAILCCTMEEIRDHPKHWIPPTAEFFDSNGLKDERAGVVETAAAAQNQLEICATDSSLAAPPPLVDHRQTPVSLCESKTNVLAGKIYQFLAHFFFAPQCHCIRIAFILSLSDKVNNHKQVNAVVCLYDVLPSWHPTSTNYTLLQVPSWFTKAVL